jgi:DNA repair protein REV1
LLFSYFSYEKIEIWKRETVVTSKWIADSILAGKALPLTNYKLTGVDKSQKQLDFHNSSSADVQIRRKETTSKDFISQYYNFSRLSKISNWKSDLKDLVSNRMESIMKTRENNEEILRTLEQARSGKRTRVLMHIDMDCFFASVGLRDRPELKNEPVAVWYY